MTPITIRPASSADLDSFFALADELRRTMAAINPATELPEPEVGRRQAAAYLDGPYNLVLLALVGGEPVGFIRANGRSGESTMLLPGRRLPWRDAARQRLRGWVRGQPRTGRPALYIADLYVRPDYRRQGVGRALLAEAERRLAPLGAEVCYLMALADNREGVEFWQRAGFLAESVIMIKRKHTPQAKPDNLA